ncbi:alkane hydroxylase MAH1-like [Primulina eburnea]|uniref:alkane hydroxylase MAH1-like n=1 Tax=Primulina eburnea TaxID=1245227 RepID=UPI003C6C05D5
MYTYILFAILLSILLVSLLPLCYITFDAERKKRSVPTEWPVLGMLPGLLLNSARVHEFVTEILQESGGSLMFKGPWFSSMDMFITSDPADVHYILSKNYPNFSKGPEFKKIFDILGGGIFMAEHESWENQRRTIMSLMNQMGFQKLVASTTWNKVEKGLVPILNHYSEMGNQVDLQELFQRLAFDSTCQVVLGDDPYSLCINLPHIPEEKAFADAEEAVLQRHTLPESLWKLQKWLQVGKEKKLSLAKELLDRFLSDRIARKCQKLNGVDQMVTYEKEDFDLLTNYMREIAEKGDALDSASISEQTWKDIMLNLIFAGKDTISAALSWFFWLLTTNINEENKIRHEISTNIQVNEHEKWEFSDMQQLNKLVYLHAALCESLRLFPPVGFQHKAPLESDVLPSGHRIKPSTKTVLSFYSMGRMESIWGKDCLEFKPKRWISDLGRIKTEPSFKFTAFNAGPRSCLGKEMSFIQLKIVAASIISRFHFNVVEGHPICPSNSVILHMKHGLKVKVSKYD